MGSRTEDRLKEVESFFALVLSMLMSFEDRDDLDKSTERLCKLFADSSEQQPELRLRLLMTLYNTFNNPSMAHRYRVFKHIVDYAAKAKGKDKLLVELCKLFLNGDVKDVDAFHKKNPAVFK